MQPWLEKDAEARKNVVVSEAAALVAKAAEVHAMENTEGKKAAFDRVQSVRREQEPNLSRKKDKLENALLLETKLKAEGQKLKVMAGQLAMVKNKSDETARLRERKTEEIVTLKSRLEEIRSQIAGCRVPAEVRNLIQAAGSDVTELENATLLVQELEKDRADRQSQLKNAATVRQNCLTVQAGAEARRVELEGGIRDLDAVYAAEEKNLAEATVKLSLCEEYAKNLNVLQREQSTAFLQLELLKQNRNKTEKTAAEAGSKAKKAAEELELARHMLNVAIQNDRRRMAATLADSLRAGCPCPVCGAQEHPRPASQSAPRVMGK